MVTITLTAATSCLFLLQAIYILKRGDTQMFFLAKSPRDASRLSTPQRIGGALVYGLPACGVFFLLFYAAFKNGWAAILGWLDVNAGNVIGGHIMFISGLLIMLRPNWLLKGVQAAHPYAQIDLESAFVAMFTRFLGAMLLGLGLFILSLTTRVRLTT